MLRKKEAYTVVTPIPGFIPRQLAIDILHAHSEVIMLNPLVLSHRPIPAPRTAAADEFYSTWYEIVERIQYVPGIGRAGSGQITFCGCFHDLPWGLQTHVHAPLNIDLRHRYRVAGNQPGVEGPDEQRELGLEELGAPRDGLYLREDIEIKCNIAMVSFVKAQLRAASRQMLDRFIKKAELLDAGVLQAMMENGKLKTINPNDRSRPPPIHAPPYPGPPSPSLVASPLRSSPSPSAGHYHYKVQDTDNKARYMSSHLSPAAPSFPVELPGDSSQDPSPGSKYLARPVSDITSTSSDPRWSLSPSFSDGHRDSVGSTVSATGLTSPGFVRHGFAAELPAHDESRELAPRPQATSYMY
ncbi:hypothetical protein HRG_002783 [Hirsutella rhossiliensis]|uniref:DUF7053 domain-containing protein n=1 Tax=Hirsutella rhossiliensis TaxID=111463 RepID=A0A9P8N509_9HYPO|nr:uncharacterized protein HRG_02783 [Hirsutella rhossiliensis]KAH0964767.1 hypothetical protein HRG_02783 [Hirsutella rhossiliensis]